MRKFAIGCLFPIMTPIIGGIIGGAIGQLMFDTINWGAVFGTFFGLGCSVTLVIIASKTP